MSRRPSDREFVAMMRTEDRHQLTRFAFMYLISQQGVEMAVSTADNSCKEIFAVIAEKCLVQSIRLLDISYSHSWSLSARNRVRTRVIEILTGIILDLEDKGDVDPAIFGRSGRINSPEGCAQSANRSVYVENSGVEL